MQAELAVAFDASQRAQQADEGVPVKQRGRGVAAQIALARRESPHRGGVLVGMAKDLTAELPYTLAAMREGRLSEYRAQLLVSKPLGLDREHRALVDAELCADPATLDGVGTRRLVGLARRLAQRHDPAAAVRRARRAESERCVTIRPAPDTMTYVTALLPVAQGVAVHAALSAAAGDAVSRGDGRSRGQLMADTLVERATGQATAEHVPVTVDLIVSDTALLGGGTEPAEIPGHGPVPAEITRHLVAHGVDADQAWIRRLYTDPAGDLVALTTRRRLAHPGLARFLRIRDQGLCRTPWCDAPARHHDHVVPAADGGATTADNTQGLCQACNHAKQAPRWRQRSDPDAVRHRVTTITPTGHRHHSTAPAPPRPARFRGPSALERALEQLLRELSTDRQPSRHSQPTSCAVTRPCSS